MKIAVISSNISCDSAKDLAEGLKAKFYNCETNNKRDFKEFDLVFKYGVSQKITANKVINNSTATAIAVDKIKTFHTLKNDKITVDYTQNISEALKWIDQGYFVVARTLSQAANGKGITFCRTASQLKKAPAKFWTKYFHHTNELRANIWKGKVLSLYDKTKKTNKEGTFFNFKLWGGQEDQPQLVHIAKTIWKQTKLDWCGVDILRDDEGNLKVLEINSAPVLYPITIKRLINEIRKEPK